MFLGIKKGFTLAEIMIALTIIGVITAILLPVAIQTTPNEKVMKFKKANATLARIINELVTSGEYYTPGDLGRKPDGMLVDGTHDGDYTYLCKTISDVISYKKINCSSNSYRAYGWIDTVYSPSTFLEDVDKACKKSSNFIGEEIIIQGDIVYFQVTPTVPFGIKTDGGAILVDEETQQDIIKDGDIRLFGGDIHVDENKFDRIYKSFCIDIDGINRGEDPFGYGIRADGKILFGARAQAWLEKDIQDKE